MGIGDRDYMKSAQTLRALAILREYYKKIAQDVAQDVIDHQADFLGPRDGEAEKRLEHHARRLNELGVVYNHLIRFAPEKKPVGKEPLGANEFRCFDCGGVIRERDECCTNCGWTWRLHR